MSLTIFTATGCTRCHIVKDYMNQKNIIFTEKDIKAEGKEEFQNFYKNNRHKIFRGLDGIEFPIIHDSGEIRQGIGSSIAYLDAGRNLDDFFSVGTLHQEWVDGIHISTGDAQYKEDFINVLRYLKSKNMKLQIDTNGKNLAVLEQVFNENLADKVIMEIYGPIKLYTQIMGAEINTEDLKRSISIIPKFPEYKFQTTVLPIERENGESSFLTPEEMMETAKLIKEETGSNKNKFYIKSINQQELKATAFKSLEPLTNSQLLAYRTKARMHQVFSEIEK